MDDSNKPENPAAFPTATEQWGGMTLRDYFAAKAMQAIISEPSTVAKMCAESGLQPMEAVPIAAYGMADGMLRAREVMK